MDRHSWIGFGIPRLYSSSLRGARQSAYGLRGSPRGNGRSRRCGPTGRGRTENSFGFGGSIGVLYEPIEKLSLGVSYTSVLHFTKLGKYSDILSNNKLNTPRQARAEIAGWPLEDWLLTAGFHWINWRSVSVLGDSPADGGLGWKNQYIAKFGTQYTIKDRVNLRAGYNWQSALLASDVIYANALVPLIAEHTSYNWD